MNKWLQRLAKLVCWLLLLLVLFLIEENVRGRILLASYKHQLRAAGDKLTLTELGLNNVPTPPDAATMELLAAAEKLGDWNPHDQEEAKFMHLVGPGTATFSWRLPINTRTWGKDGSVTNTWSAVAEQLQTNAPTLSAAMDALRRNPRGVSIDWHKEESEFFGSAYKLCDRLRYWLMWATANNLREGKLDEATETALAIVRLGKTFQGHHSGYCKKFIQCGLDATWELLQSGATNEARLIELQDILSSGEILSELAKSQEAYRAWNLKRIEAQTWEQVHRGSGSFYSLPLQNLPSTMVITWFWVGRSFDEYAFLIISQDRLRSQRDVAQTRQWKSWQQPWPKSLLWCFPWWTAMPFSMNEHWDSQGVLRTFEYETQREMAIAAIALHRFRLHHGQWPERLEELVPELLPALPRDWMDGQPLRYRRNANDTFTFYSVGEDFRDDGGNPTNFPNMAFDQYPQPIWRGYDAVWPRVTTSDNSAVH